MYIKILLFNLLIFHTLEYFFSSRPQIYICPYNNSYLIEHYSHQIVNIINLIIPYDLIINPYENMTINYEISLYIPKKKYDMNIENLTNLKLLNNIIIDFELQYNLTSSVFNDKPIPYFLGKGKKIIKITNINLSPISSIIHCN